MIQGIQRVPGIHRIRMKAQEQHMPHKMLVLDVHVEVDQVELDQPSSTLQMRRDGVGASGGRFDLHRHGLCAGSAHLQCARFERP